MTIPTKVLRRGVLAMLSVVGPLCMTFAQTQPWARHTIDSSSTGADGVKMADINGDGDLDVLICEENYGPNSKGLGVIWYENPYR